MRITYGSARLKSAHLVAGVGAITLVLTMATGATAATPVPAVGASRGGATAASAADVQRAVVPLAKGDRATIAVGTTNGVDILTANPPEVGGFGALTKLWVHGWDDNVPWTEYDCTTGDGRFMAVAFAPASLTNHPDREPNAGFGAIVNTVTGAQWTLPYRVTLQYHTPGCGVGDQVVFTSGAGIAAANTDVISVDAAKSTVIDVRHVTGQITSAIPVAGQVLAAQDDTLVSVSAKGKLTNLSKESGPLYYLRPDAGGHVDFLVKTGASQASARKYVGPGNTLNLGVGPLTNLGLFAGYAGSNHLVGTFTPTILNDLDIVTADKPPVALSQRGSVIITDEQIPGVTTVKDADLTIGLRARTSTRTIHVPLRVNPAASADGGPASSRPNAKRSTTAAAPQGGSTAPLTAQATTTVTASPCSVAPLDPATQIIQPSAAQVEWAANRAVRGLLTDTRPANWQKHGLPAYSAQSLFPAPALVGGGRIPVQVLEGVLAQESNFSQASPHALPGVAGDPLIANYYGTTYYATTDPNSPDYGHILSSDYSKADCGYGVGQITQHMTTADTTWSASTKREVATDYEVNIAAAVSILAKTWNQLNSSPENITMNDADPNKIENWYATLWAYNSGIQPTATYGNTTGCTPGPACTYHGYWGLGWTNNPIQNAYPPNRTPFLKDGHYGDASHPGDWPYQEKVLGWAQHPQQDPYNAGQYKYVGSSTALSLPLGVYTFCGSTQNNCSSGSTSTGFCLSTDRTTCWWHSPVTWLGSGQGTLENAAAYVAGAVEPTVADPYPASCSVGASAVQGTPGITAVPAGAVVVDDLPDSSTNLAGCATVSSSGTFSMAYGQDALGNEQGKIDTHQIGVGYMGHSYFTHTIDSRPNVLATGTWTPPSTVVGWQRIWVHIPDNGAVTFQADYQIYTGSATFHRVVNQRWNKNTWFDLGSFQLSAGAKVYLSNATHGDFATKFGAIDISYDAIAFTPSAKPALSYVAFGDSYQAGEGLDPYYANADKGGGSAYINSCHRSPQAYPPLVFNDLKAAHPGNQEFHFIACSGAVIKDVKSGGTEHSNEVPQLDSGWLDANTTHVTIGIGGNDARFGAIIKGCIMTMTLCTDPSYKLTVDQPDGSSKVDPEALVTYEPKVIDGLATPLSALFSSIRSKAPNAQIAVVGYAHVVATATPRRDGVGCAQFDNPTITFFAQMGDRLNGVIAAAASANSNGASFVNPAPVFAGPPAHEACTYWIADEWINATTAPSSSGSGDSFPTGSGSFHPKTTGHVAIENLVKASLS